MFEIVLAVPQLAQSFMKPSRVTCALWRELRFWHRCITYVGSEVCRPSPYVMECLQGQVAAAAYAMSGQLPRFWQRGGV
eukprot:4206888-Amphidinium_carterae.2